MSLQKGFPLLVQQLKALLRKNLSLTCRNRGAMFTQLLSPILFMFLLFGIQSVQKLHSSLHTDLEKDPQPQFSLPIPPCEDKFIISSPCFDFVWTGQGDAIADKIVKAIRDNNSGRPIPSDKVKSFKTKDQLDEWLVQNPLKCPVALHLDVKNTNAINYGLQINSTVQEKRGQFEDPHMKFHMPLKLAAQREIARTVIGDPDFSWSVGLTSFAHPAPDILDSGEEAIVAVVMENTFFLVIGLFGFVFLVNSLVEEKELKLRQAMNMMGLYDSAYWLSWLIWEGVIAFLSSLITVLCGIVFHFDALSNNSFLLVFCVFFFFQLAMIGFGFFLSTIIHKSSASTTVGLAVFIAASTCANLVSISKLPYQITSESFRKYKILVSMFPPIPFSYALTVLREAGSDANTDPDDAITWSGRDKCPPNNIACPGTIADMYGWLVLSFLLWFVLALYLDNTIPNANGASKPIFYFLEPSYWTGRGGNNSKGGGIFSCKKPHPLPEQAPIDDEDVQEEEATAKQQANDGIISPDVAVHIRGLIKTYPPARRGAKPFHAVKGLWLNIHKNQLLCLLGPNGAGKTTTISCLTGISPATDGDALICGHSIRSSVGMANIRQIIGVCPQFDILWETLSGLEHLELFSNIKGLPQATIKETAKRVLTEVRITDAASRRAGSYSGGMKRRLSVAIALLGDPELVILDEPTTGMDPITRRHVWDVIQDAKKGRAIVLTTHSMEEADILADRLGIMAKGRLRCIGTSIRLKSKFGTGFVASLSFNESTDDNKEDAKQFFKERLNVEAKEESKAFLSFVIPHDKESLLTNFFEELQGKAKSFGITDIQLSLATLEEVFMNIARQAQLEEAVAEQKETILTLSSGLELKIPVGARHVGIPNSISAEHPKGLMVEVYWDLDHSGVLTISGHSPEFPVS